MAADDGEVDEVKQLELNPSWSSLKFAARPEEEVDSDN